MNATGAVVVGRRTAEQVGYYGGDHHGARTALEAGVLDELQLSVVPVLFGSGLRLFDVQATASSSRSSA